MKLTTITVRGTKLEVSVSNDGSFSVEIEKETISAYSLKDLTEKAERLMKRKPISIEFYRWDGKLQHGFVTGIHANNGHYLVRFEGMKGGIQEYHWSTDASKYLRLTEEEQKEYTQLCEALEAQQAIIEKFEKAHTFSHLLKQEVHKALNIEEK